MSRSSVRLRRTPRRRAAWCLAVIAALLNALAPVFAYAIGQPLHELAGGRPGGGTRAVLAAAAAGAHAVHDGHESHVHAAHAGMAHAGHLQADAADDPGEHAAPHCPYCLDFAAGAPLGTSAPVILAAQDGHAPLPATQPARVAARSSLRLASPRGPPRAG